MSFGQRSMTVRNEALAELKFKRKKGLDGQDSSTSSSSTSLGGLAPKNGGVPLQSRDATVPSRYFPASTNGTVLVPNSSPPPPTSDLVYRPHQSHHHPSSHNSSTFTTDPLSASSGFTRVEHAKHASFTRPEGEATRRPADSSWGDDAGPPRKRIHLSSSARDPLDFLTTPPSPEVQLPGQRRRLLTTLPPNSPASSVDSMPDLREILNGNAKRIIRGRRPSLEPPSHLPTTPQADRDNVKLQRFIITMPGQPRARVVAAWEQSNGNVAQATALVLDTGWNPDPPESSPLGRDAALEQKTKADRAATKEKGKKSLIYANRGKLEAKPSVVSTPSPSATPISISSSSATPKATIAHPVKQSKLRFTPPPPDSPIVITSSPLGPRPRRKAKKLVMDSDSDGDFGDDYEDGGKDDDAPDSYYMTRTLQYFNDCGMDALQELTGCTAEQAKCIFDLRPFETITDLQSKLGQNKKKAGPGGISPRMFDDCVKIFEGYGTVDDVLEKCERIGASLRAAIGAWTSTIVGKGKGKGKEKEGSGLSTRAGSVASLEEGDLEDGALNLHSLTVTGNAEGNSFIPSPSMLSDTVQLKDYQLLGVNWLNLLYQKRLSCILADEMGLGKTVQVIGFFAYLREQGCYGPHLIVVPSSTLENWCREFARFAPLIAVQTYYAGKEDRVELRQMLMDTRRRKGKSGGWEVLITTYNLAAQGDERDRKFFRKVEWETCVYDEGHTLKNFQSQRYQNLTRINSNWRILLTGTPLQNNLQELVSLMNFILPHHFAGAIDSLRAIFKVKGDSKASLLSQERVSRAKKMMTPFVLRRRKDQVLKDLPKKTERIEWCDMTPLQKSIYRDALQRSRKTIFDLADPHAEPVETPTANGRGAKATKKKPRAKDKMYLENSSNVLMDLRKAASHPMLFRRLFTDETLSSMTRLLLKEADFKKRGAVFEYVKEDMQVMTDAELQLFCATYKSLRKFSQKEDCYLQAGKIKALLKLLKDYSAEGRRVLVFSQFTQILDIVQAVLKHEGIKYLLLTGSTAVDVRQALVDEFTEDDSIPVFLLSTKAGGMGINLTAASAVIMFDQDFNPHNDRQAQDRAYRIGQKRDVEVVKLITRGTVEEDMLRLGETKLALDEAVAGDGEEGDGGGGGGSGESAPEKAMRTSLMSVLRKQFEAEETQCATADDTATSTAVDEDPLTPISEADVKMRDP